MKGSDGKQTKPCNFTLIELLIVIAIIAILAAMLLQALNKARNMAKHAQCVSNVKNIMLGMLGYTDDNQGYFPGRDTGAGTYRFWYRNIYRQVSGRTWNAGENSILKSFNFLRCPIHIIPSNVPIDYPTIAYGINDNISLVMVNRVRVPSKAFITGDSDDDGYYGMIIAADIYGLGDRHQGKASVGIADGHVQQIYAKQYNLPDVILGSMTAGGTTIVRTNTSAVSKTTCPQIYKDSWGFRGGGYNYMTK